MMEVEDMSKEEISCDKYGCKAESQELLDVHMETNKPMRSSECRKCDAFFDDESELSEHMERKHII